MPPFAYAISAKHRFCGDIYLNLSVTHIDKAKSNIYCSGEKCFIFT